MNKLLFLTKSFLNHKKNSFMVLLTISLSLICVITIMNVIKTNETISLEELFNTYGRYTVAVEDSSVFDKLQDISKDPEVKSIYKLKFDSFNLSEEQQVDIYRTDERLFNYVGVDIIEGKFPSNEHEIALERSYLLQQGITSEKMVGSQVIVPISPTESKEFTVSGVIQFNKATDQATTINILLLNNGNDWNRVLIQVNNLENYMISLDYLTNKFDLDKEKCFVNYDLFVVLGIVTGESTLESNTRLYFFILAIILLCTVLSLLNVLKILISDISVDIAIANMLGISKLLISGAFFLYIQLVILEGLGIGIIFSYSITLPLINLFITEHMSIYELIKNTRTDLLLITVAVYLFISGLMVIPSVVRLNKMTAMQLFNTSIETGLDTCVKASSAFTFKRNSFIRKLSFKNLFRNKGNAILNIIAIAIAISVLVIGLYYTELNTQVSGYSSDRDYKIVFDDKDEITQKSIYARVNSISGTKAYPEYITENRAWVKRETLSKKLVDFIENNYEDDLSLINYPGSKARVNIILIGYDDNQMKQLYQTNGCSGELLANNEAIVLDKTIPLRGKEGFAVDFTEGDVIEASSYDSNDSMEKTALNVKHVFKKLNTYPNGFYNMICVIVNEDTYKRISGTSYPNALYLECTSADTETVEQIISGYNSLSISFPKEQERHVIFVNQILRRVTMLFFTIILITVAVSLFCSMYTRIKLSQHDYVSYKSLGISSDVLVKISAVEYVVIYILGIILGGLISWGLTKYIQYTMLGNVGIYVYSYPMHLWIYSVLLGLLGLFACLCPIIRQIYSINVVRYLKETT